MIYNLKEMPIFKFGNIRLQFLTMKDASKAISIWNKLESNNKMDLFLTVINEEIDCLFLE